MDRARRVFAIVAMALLISLVSYLVSRELDLSGSSTPDGPTTVELLSPTFPEPSFAPDLLPSTSPIVLPSFGPDESQPTDTTATGGMVDEVRECELRVAQAGLQVSFFPRAVMMEGEAHEVGAVVSLRGSEPVLVPGPDTAEPTVVELPGGRCLLSARLSGGSAFEIDPPDSVEQSFLSIDVTSLTWSWQVTPVEAGRLALRLTITPLVRSRDFGTFAGAEQPFEAQIDVTSRPDNRSRWRKLNDFIDEPVPKTILSFAVAGGSLAGVVTAVIKWRGRETKRPVEPAPNRSKPRRRRR